MTRLNVPYRSLVSCRASFVSLNFKERSMFWLKSSSTINPHCLFNRLFSSRIASEDRTEGTQWSASLRLFFISRRCHKNRWPLYRNTPNNSFRVYTCFYIRFMWIYHLETRTYTSLQHISEIIQSYLEVFSDVQKGKKIFVFSSLTASSVTVYIWGMQNIYPKNNESIINALSYPQNRESKRLDKSNVV